MNVPNLGSVTAILIAPLLCAGTPAHAFSARQATAQGQGMFVTSSGTPQNMIASEPVAQQENANRRPLHSHQHDRYFAEF